jgi:hypothetical protein
MKQEQDLKEDAKRKPLKALKKLADSWKVVFLRRGSAGEVWAYCRKRYVAIGVRLKTRGLLTGRNSIY